MWQICCKGHRRKQTDILVSFVLPALIFSSFFLTFYQKHDFASNSLCLRVVCDRSKLIWLPQSNVTLKSFIVFNRMCLSSGNVYNGPYSPVKWLRSRINGRRQEGSVRTTLISHSPNSIHQGMLSISLYIQKKVTHVVSVCINLDCVRVEYFSVSARRFGSFTALFFCFTHKIRRYRLLALSTNPAENFDGCLRLVFIFLCSLFVSLMKYYDDYLTTDLGALNG